MVKYWLMGTAAVFSVASAQAADLPIKAKPVEYVKVCSLYGAGFYYIPGTDTCIRVGGHIRAEVSFNSRGTNIQQNAPGDGSATDTRDRDIYFARSRAFLNLDTRTQTAYGTLRTFSVMRFQLETPVGTAGATTTPGLDAAMIQWGGFTIGRASTSFMDAPFNYAYKWTPSFFGTSDTAGGRFVAAYTHQFGNGLSGTIALEDSKERRRPFYNGSLALTSGVGATIAPNSAGGNTWPDIVGQLRVDQAWGRLHLAAMATNVHAAYYCAGTAGCTQLAGAPSDKVGFAVNGGLAIKTAWGVNDSFYLNGTYARGATRETFSNIGQGSSVGLFGNGNSITTAYLVDSVFATGGQQQLTTTYGGMAGYEHGWNNEWRTSIYGGAAFVDYNSTANGILCARFGVAGNSAGVLSNAGTTCNMDYVRTGIGSRTYWSPVRDLTIGVEVLWTQHHSKNAGATLTIPTTNFRPAGAYAIRDQDVFSGMFSVRRFF